MQPFVAKFQGHSKRKKLFSIGAMCEPTNWRINHAAEGFTDIGTKHILDVVIEYFVGKKRKNSI